VVAFRDTHRAESLESVAKEFTKAWGTALLTGATDKQVFDTLVGPLCDTSVSVQSIHPMGCTQGKGPEGMWAKLMRDHKALAGGQPAGPVKLLLAGANDSDDTAFVMLELPPMSAKPKVAGVMDASGPSAASDTSYMLLKVEMLLDDTVRRVTSVMERGQLAGGFDLPVAQQAMAGDKAHHQQGCPKTPVFPTHMIMPWARQSAKTPGAPCPDMVQRVEESLKSWVKARCSGQNTREMMKAAGCTDDFQLFDGYGLMPMMCDVVADAKPETAVQTASMRSCVLRGNQVADLLDACKGVYEIDAHVVDYAVSVNEAAGFVHWKGTHRNKKTGETLEVEGMEVDLFEPSSGALRAVYLFGDALDNEGKQLLEEMARVANEAAQPGRA